MSELSSPDDDVRGPGVATAVLVGASDPSLGFFGYQDGVSRLLPDATRVEALAAPTDDAAHALAALADALGAAPFVAPASQRPPSRPTGTAQQPITLCPPPSPTMIPEGAVVVDEGVSIAGSILPVSTGAPRHSYLMLTGGACGQGMPCAAGAAIGASGRKVIALVGDGSALYTVQALWTQAREGLDVVNVVCANDAYRILHVELTKLLGALPGPRASKLTELASRRRSTGAASRRASACPRTAPRRRTRCSTRSAARSRRRGQRSSKRASEGQSARASTITSAGSRIHAPRYALK